MESALPVSVCVVVNRSKRVSDLEVANAVVGIRKWAHDVGRAWDCEVPLVHVGTTTSAATFGAIILQDGLDEPDALGYHDVIAGRPTGLVDVAGTIDVGGKWTVTLTHELAEMIVDPWCLSAAQCSSSSWVAQELCDPVEDDRYALTYADVACTDFVLPSYFAPGSKGPFDAGGHLTHPVPQILPGGYLSIWTAGRGWQQRSARLEDLPTRALRSRRHELRTALTEALG